MSLNTRPASNGRIERSYGWMYSVLHTLGSKKYDREIGARQFGSVVKPLPGLNESVHRSAAEAIGAICPHIQGNDNRAWQPTKLKAALDEGLPITD